MKTVNEKIKYDAWLQWNVTTRCNMNCQYCFDFDKKSKKFGEILEINIPELIKTLNKTNKFFRINFIGGEPFLTPNIVEACIQLTKKHYVSFNTNLTSTKLKEFCENINPKKVSYILAALHIKELEKRNLLNRYIDNFLLCKQKGFNIIAIVVAHPSLINEVEKYTKFFKEKNIDIKFTAFIGKYNEKNYPDEYTTKERNIFKINKKDNKNSNQKGKICNAGYNSGIIQPNGDIFRCLNINEKIGNIYNNILFDEHLIKCPVEFCGCPLKDYDKYLFNKALKENTKLKNTFN